ncbi:hypothetical protein JTB14_009524 [Gonioctena quinquepunctata]|nr:hypothetical protein JTB14_009524 [Gonioctena quinquepunctata]
MGTESPGDPGGKFLKENNITEYRNLIINSPSTKQAVENLLNFAGLHEYNPKIFNELVSGMDIKDNIITEFEETIKDGYFLNSTNDMKIQLPNKINIIADIVLKKAGKKEETIKISDNSQYNLIDKDDNKYKRIKIQEESKSDSVRMEVTNAEEKKPINNVDFKYEANEIGPYSIYIESLDKNIGSISNLRVGKLFHSNKNYNPDIIEKRGRNRLLLTFKKLEEANKLLDDEHFLKSNNFKASIPYNAITSKVIIKDIETTFSEEELKDNIKTIGNKKVIHVRRLKKKSTPSGDEGGIQYIDIPVILVTFRGKFAPEKVFIYSCAFETQNYYSPVIQCHNCMRYGHTKAQCKGSVRCPVCAEKEKCLITKLSCLFCKGNHLTNEPNVNFRARVCPEFLRQKRIKEIIGERNISFFDAANMLDPKNKGDKGDGKTQYQFNINNYPPLTENKNGSNPSVSQRERCSSPKANSLQNYNKIVRKTQEERIKSTPTVIRNDYRTPKRGYIMNV